MAITIISGCNLRLDDSEGCLWSACNGAKRTRLALYRASGIEVERVPTTEAGLVVHIARGALPTWYQPDWREAAVYLQPSDADALYHVRLNTHCGFNTVPKDAELWSAWSWGGPKNSASKIAVIEGGSYCEIISYKHASPYSYVLLGMDGEVRWLGERSEVLAKHFRGDKDATRLAELKGWLTELTAARSTLEVHDE